MGRRDKRHARPAAATGVKDDRATAACPFAPLAGRRCRQADEGRVQSCASAAWSASPLPLSSTSTSVLTPAFTAKSRW
ncbi:hypothetical protein CN204_28160 [Sinorhizobium meliloti]|nr:hypothetical protein CN204_28160 [Sinorhizobium meliloti]RVM23121.1 hypothetical protein CN132_24275 [Sinorhizobium meliloti]